MGTVMEVKRLREVDVSGLEEGKDLFVSREGLAVLAGEDREGREVYAFLHGGNLLWTVSKIPSGLVCNAPMGAGAVHYFLTAVYRGDREMLAFQHGLEACGPGEAGFPAQPADLDALVIAEEETAWIMAEGFGAGLVSAEQLQDTLGGPYFFAQREWVAEGVYYYPGMDMVVIPQGIPAPFRLCFNSKELAAQAGGLPVAQELTPEELQYRSHWVTHPLGHSIWQERKPRPVIADEEEENFFKLE